MALEAVAKTYDHGLSAALIAELEAFKPAFAGAVSDDACLRAWKSIEKVAFQTINKNKELQKKTYTCTPIFADLFGSADLI